MSDTQHPRIDSGQATEKDGRVYNRQELVAQVAEKTGLLRAKAAAAVLAMIGCTSSALKEGKEVRLTGFGAFQVSERKVGNGHDPRSGAEIDVPQSKSVRFRVGKVLRELVAGTIV